MTAPLASLRTATAFTLLLAVAACGGGGGGGAAPVTPPSNLSYPVDPGVYRVAEAIADNVPSVQGGAVASWDVTPALPAGLTLDPVTGTIAGTPTAEASTTTHTVTATNAGGSTQADVDIAVGAELPTAFVSLREGFQAEALFTAPDVMGVVKMARTPDGRILFVEKDTGQVRAWDAQGGLEATPYLDLSSVMLGMETWTLLQGSHRGLIAIAIHPDFVNNGFLYVMLTVEDSMMANPKTIVLRFTDDDINNVGTNQALVLDNLPTANINNGGELLFDATGTHLFITMGDIEDATTAQQAVNVAVPSTLGGKILRVEPNTPATIPASNASGTFEWVRGMRNCYGMAFNPDTGGLFAVDTEGMDSGTGFDMVDELNLIVEGKNCEWGAMPGTIPVGDRGFVVWDSPNITVTPTCLAWHTGAAFSTAFTDTLLMGWYNADAEGYALRAFTMAGVSRADVDDETDFAKLAIDGGNGVPLDLDVDTATDDIYVALLGGVYRISAIQ
ncbi:MAG: PQQ-dependent sugar dehydrogenase [Planctomycetota bacterium]|nr:PQQ-dependent sugar dehydrogenase [Planctomycetota bacterium]